MADIFNLLFVCLYHGLHALYSVAVCIVALARLCTSHMQRRGQTALRPCVTCRCAAVDAS